MDNKGHIGTLTPEEVRRYTPASVNSKQREYGKQYAPGWERICAIPDPDEQLAAKRVVAKTMRWDQLLNMETGEIVDAFGNGNRADRRARKAVWLRKNKKNKT